MKRSTSRVVTLSLPSERIDEALIERYVRHPSSLSASVRGKVREQIESDPAARETAAFYAEFYQTLDEVTAATGTVDTEVTYQRLAS